MTKRIAQTLSIEQAEAKAIAVLKSKGHTTRPNMNTYAAYNEPVEISCSECGDTFTMKFNNICERGRECSCFKAKKKIAVREQRKQREEQKKAERLANKKPVVSKSPQQRWIDNNYEERLKEKVPNLIPYPDTFIHKDIPMNMRCTICDSDVPKRVGDALKGNNCRNCFGVGFRSDRDAVIYILGIYDEEELIAYKVGITNKTANDRCEAINNNTNLNAKVLQNYTGNGKYIQTLESYILSLIPTGYLDKDVFTDGYTETFSPEHLDRVMAVLSEEFE